MWKAKWEIETEMKKVDLFIEVRDAWIPYTSRNEHLIELVPKGVKRLVVLNKIDLADPVKTKAYIDFVKKYENVSCFGLSASKYYEIENLLNFI